MRMAFFLALAVPASAAQARLELKDFAAVTWESQGFSTAKGLATLPVRDQSAGDYALDFGRPLPAGTEGLALLGREGFLDRAAEFLQPDNRLSLRSPAHPFFDGGTALGSFVLECRVFPYETGLEARLVEKAGMAWDAAGGRLVRQGLTVSLSGGVCAVRLENFFHVRGKSYTTQLRRGRPLVADRWHHVGLRYDAMAGLLVKSLDGEEEDRCWTTADGTEHGVLPGAGYYPGHRAPLVLGEGFLGRLEGLRISLHPTARLVADPWPDSVCRWTSRVLSLKPHSRVKRFSVALPGGLSSLELRARTAPAYFLADDERLRWRQVPVNTMLPEGLLEDGSHVQLSLVLRNQSVSGAGTLSALGIEYEVDEVPNPPQILSAVAKAGAVELEWQVGTEEDLAGYRVWWAPSGQPLTKKRSARRTLPYVRPVEAVSAESARLRYRLDGLEDGICYRVAVTAWDRRGEEHDSEFSRMVELVPDRWAE